MSTLSETISEITGNRVELGKLLSSTYSDLLKGESSIDPTDKLANLVDKVLNNNTALLQTKDTQLRELNSTLSNLGFEPLEKDLSYDMMISELIRILNGK